MFVMRSRSIGRLVRAEAQGEEGEPSSLKVTCIGHDAIDEKKEMDR